MTSSSLFPVDAKKRHRNSPLKEFSRKLIDRMMRSVFHAYRILKCPVWRRWFSTEPPRALSIVDTVNELDLDQIPEKLPAVESQLSYLKRLGISDTECEQLLFKFPNLQKVTLKQPLTEKLQFLSEKGMNRQGMIRFFANVLGVYPEFLLCNVLMHMPPILTLSMEAHLKPRMAYYRECLLFSQNEMLKIFEECPEFLQYSIVKDIRFRVQYFERMGMTLEELTKLVILQCPQVLGSTYHKELRPMLEYFRSVTSTKCVHDCLCCFPHLMLLSVESQLKPFVHYFQEELQMGRRLFSQMLQMHPRILTADVERDVRPKIDLLRKLGLDQLQLFKIVWLKLFTSE